MNSWPKNLVAIGVLSALMPLSLPVYAQDAANEADTVKVDEVITINARRRDESIQEVPVTVNVFSSAEIESRGLTSAADLLDKTPGIDFDGTNGGEGAGRSIGTLTMRGISGSSNVGAKVSSFVDGMPMSGSQGVVSLYDVASVEIYRGAQSAVFGRSTFAGAINYLTKNPTDEFEGRVNTEIGQDGKWVLGATLSGPITEELGYYFNYTKDNYDGQDDWVTTDGVNLGASESEYLSTKLVWLASDDLTLHVGYNHVEIFDTPSASYYVDSNSANRQYLTDTPTPVTAKAYIGEVDWKEYRDPDNIYTRNHFSNNGGNNVDVPGTSLTRDRFTVDLSWDVLDDYSIKFKGFHATEDQFNWRDRDSTDLYSANDGSLVEHWSSTSELKENYLEAFISSDNDDDGFTWHAGASYYKYDLSQIDRVDQNADLVMGETGSEITNKGVFFALFYDLTEDVDLSFEARAQTDDVTNGSALYDVSTSSSTDSFLPRAAIHWSIDKNTNFYGQISKGNNPAGANLGTLLPRTMATAALVDGRNGNTAIADKFDLFKNYGEEEIWTYEIGFKGDAFDNSLRYTTALYYIEWSNALNVVTYNWYDGGVDGMGDVGYAFPVDYLLPITTNSGEIGGMGWEGEISYDVTDNFEVTAALSYVGLEYTDYCSVDAQDTYGLTATGDVKGVPCYDVDGNMQAGISEKSAAFSALYHHELSNNMEFFARADVNWQSKQYLDNLNLSWMPAFAKANVRAGIRSENWDVELYVNNITDDDTPASIGTRVDGYGASPTAFGPGTFNVNIQPSQGRMVGLRASYTF